ncbi:succinate dehydrogenase, cytochrome b556 subunit [Marinomonas sp.]
MSKERPVNLDIATINLPITAFVSILHRVSSVILWVGLAIFLPVLLVSLSSAEGHQTMKDFFTGHFLGQFIVWGLLTALGYYICATSKHIIQDFGHFEELESGKQISLAVLVVAGLLSILSGVWLWA